MILLYDIKIIIGRYKKYVDVKKTVDFIKYMQFYSNNNDVVFACKLDCLSNLNKMQIYKRGTISVRRLLGIIVIVIEIKVFENDKINVNSNNEVKKKKNY